MDILLIILGFALIALAVFDLLSNTLVLNGAGKVSQYISSYVWQILWRIAGKNGKSGLLSYSSIFIIVAMFIYYLASTWLGVWLIYISAADSIISAVDYTAASKLEKFYFTGYVISTMGLGDFQPKGEFYQVITSAFSLLGLSVMTLFVSYIIPASSAGVEKQVLGNYISNLGSTPSELLRKGYDEKNQTIYEEEFKELYPMLLRHTEKHLAYPILHYYHDKLPENSFIVNVVKLDEALQIIRYYVPDEVVKQKNVNLLISAIDNFMKVVKSQSSLLYAPEEPPAPMERIKKDEIPFKLKEPAEDLMEEWEKRRMEWQRMLFFEGWDFHDVYHQREE